MKTWIVSLKIFLVFTLITGFIYPLVITGIAKTVFPQQASGSLVYKNNVLVGSRLIGQNFDSSIYFYSRPSAILYNPIPSGGSNYSLTNKKLVAQVAQRKVQFISSNQLDSLTQVPSEMLFASASGLDPHTSVNAALLQVNRIVWVRKFNDTQKNELLKCISSITEQPQYHFLGDKRINVLLLNMELDKIAKSKR